jgi:hypothetical protein
MKTAAKGVVMPSHQSCGHGFAAIRVRPYKMYQCQVTAFKLVHFIERNSAETNPIPEGYITTLFMVINGVAEGLVPQSF